MSRLKIYFIRHGITKYNQLGLLCGQSNIVLCQEGWDELKMLKDKYDYPPVERVYSSPAIRCQETASILYPDNDPIIKEGLWELGFGDYEGKSAKILFTPEIKEKWFHMDPDLGFPNGETLLEASFRVRAAMTRIVKECLEDDISTIAVIAHGAIFGQLMAYCLKSDDDSASFTLTPNGMGILVSLDKEDWFFKQEMEFEALVPEGAERPRTEDSPYFSEE